MFQLDMSLKTPERLYPQSAKDVKLFSNLRRKLKIDTPYIPIDAFDDLQRSLLKLGIRLRLTNSIVMQPLVDRLDRLLVQYWVKKFDPGFHNLLERGYCIGLYSPRKITFHVFLRGTGNLNMVQSRQNLRHMFEAHLTDVIKSQFSGWALDLTAAKSLVTTGSKEVRYSVCLFQKGVKHHGNTNTSRK